MKGCLLFEGASRRVDRSEGLRGKMHFYEGKIFAFLYI